MGLIKDIIKRCGLMTALFLPDFSLVSLIAIASGNDFYG